MKKNLTLWVVLILTAGFANAQSTTPTRLLRHIVLLTFKEGAPASGIKEVDDSFRNLSVKLKQVKAYETGTVLAEGQSKTITHVYTFGFTSEQDLASYGASPEHQQHIKIGVSIIERGQAIDYWTTTDPAPSKH